MPNRRLLKNDLLFRQQETTCPASLAPGGSLELNTQNHGSLCPGPSVTNITSEPAHGTLTLLGRGLWGIAQPVPALGPMETVGCSSGPAPPLRAGLGIMPTSRHVSTPFLAKAVETVLWGWGSDTGVHTVLQGLML